jgi:hypothetical protein
MFYMKYRRGVSMAKWLRLLTLNHLLFTAVGSNPNRDWILSCEEAIQLAYGMLVVLLR